jgi:microcystin-dependent protein
VATLSITKQWANGEILLEADLDFIKSDVETFLNVTKINDDNIQTGGITGSTKLADTSVTAAKLATDSVTTAKIVDSNVTTAKIADLNVTYGKLAAAAIATLIPVGTIWVYAGTTAPSGWLLCDGSAISRTTYSDLNTLLNAASYPYGSGDGSTTFNIPDIRGRVVAGQDDMGGTSANRLTAAVAESLNGDTLGATGGAETHQLTIAQMPQHQHGGATGQVSETSMENTAPQNNNSAGGGSFQMTGNSNDSYAHTHTIANEGGNGVHNNVQPTIILNYIIRTGV